MIIFLQKISLKKLIRELYELYGKAPLLLSLVYCLLSIILLWKNEIWFLSLHLYSSYTISVIIASLSCISKFNENSSFSSPLSFSFTLSLSPLCNQKYYIQLTIVELLDYLKTNFGDYFKFCHRKLNWRRPRDPSTVVSANK